MIAVTTFTDEVRETVSHKFGGSRRATAAWIVSMDGCMDEEGGDSEAPTGWFGRIGRTMLYVDSQGFVSAHRARSVQCARDEFARFEEEYSAWDEEV
jgi:hypothetical protein